MFKDMLATAKKGDAEQLRSMIRAMEIPDYEVWFTKNFGKEKGESWVTFVPPDRCKACASKFIRVPAMLVTAMLVALTENLSDATLFLPSRQLEASRTQWSRVGVRAVATSRSSGSNF